MHRALRKLDDETVKIIRQNCFRDSFFNSFAEFQETVLQNVKVTINNSET